MTIGHGYGQRLGGHNVAAHTAAHRANVRGAAMLAAQLRCAAGAAGVVWITAAAASALTYRLRACRSSYRP